MGFLNTSYFCEVDNIISDRNQENENIEKSFPKPLLVGESYVKNSTQHCMLEWMGSSD